MAVTVWILGDQLLQEHPALSLAEKDVSGNRLRVLMIESQERAQRHPYHQKKLVLLFSAMRHYAEKLRNTGFEVDYRISSTTSMAIENHIQSHHPEKIYTMAASEYRGRVFQENLQEKFKIPVKLLPNTQFLVGRYDPYPDPDPDKRYLQENFYREMRQYFNLLIGPDGQPSGGAWNFDKNNRLRLPKDVQPPVPISFKADEITTSVIEEVEQKYIGIGQATGFDYAVTHEAAQSAADDFFDNRLADFGAYEDAMSNTHGTLFHSRLSPYLNLGLLEPLKLAQEAEKRFLDGKAPINSAEGFIRQLVGWREYIYWQYWRMVPGIDEANFFNARRELPQMFWHSNTQMNCLQKVIWRALNDGYTHHIERLMILSNFCLLAGIAPQEVNAWFLSAYIDAYEWVMLPNVYGMGLYADGGQISTKPYISSANYINKMSDYCRNCSFDHKLRSGVTACPYNYLYWNFILTHEDTLKTNPRMGRSLLGLRRFDSNQREQIKENTGKFLESLQ